MDTMSLSFSVDCLLLSSFCRLVSRMANLKTIQFQISTESGDNVEVALWVV